jgi:hypothetical protein
MRAEWRPILKGGRIMNIAFALLSTVLGLLTVGATALHWHNSMEIDRFLAAQGKQDLLPDQADIAGR